MDFTFFAGDEGFTRNTWPMARKAGSDIIDLSYGLENEKGVLLRAPWVERELGLGPRVDFTPVPVTIAHPAAVVLALLMLRAQKVGSIARAVATIFQPASEYGKRGMDELHEQTVNLLSFQQLPQVGVRRAGGLQPDRSLWRKGAFPDEYRSKAASSRHFRSLVGDRWPCLR